MFEVGFTELLVIFVLALVVLGPEKLPRLAQQIGRWIGRARAMAKQFREQLEDEVNLADMKKWEQTPPARPAHDPAESTSTATATPQGESTATDASTSHAEPAPHTEQTPHAEPAATPGTTTSAAPETPPAAGTRENPQASSEHHDSGPPPEPEAAVYQPPAYATGNGATPHASSTDSPHAVESPPPHAPVPATDEPPARPGDVVTHTHERGI